jgi:hypothetical protein
VKARFFISGALVSRTDNCGVSGGVGVTRPGTSTCNNVGSLTLTTIEFDVNDNKSRESHTGTVTDPTGACATSSLSKSSTQVPTLSPTLTPSSSPSSTSSSIPTVTPSSTPSAMLNPTDGALPRCIPSLTSEPWCPPQRAFRTKFVFAAMT